MSDPVPQRPPDSRQPEIRVLLLIDLINTWQMSGGKQLLPNTMAILPNLVRLRARATRAGVPLIFVNDNFGQWRSDFRQVIEHARAAGANAARIVDALHPGAEDYFVLKPKHSAFFSTPLDLLLQQLRATTLVLCGVAGDQCVLATAGDALVRNYRVIVPRDTIACASARRTAAVLSHFREAMELATPNARSLRWRAA